MHRARPLNPVGTHTCLDCGFEAKGGGGLTAHRRGDRCKVGTARRRHQAAGLVPVNLRHRPLLQSAGITFIDDFTKYTEASFEGGLRIAARTEKGCWVDLEIASAFKKLNFWATDAIEPPFGFTERLKMLAMLGKDAGLRSAWIALDAILRDQHMPDAEIHQALWGPRQLGHAPPTRSVDREKRVVERRVDVGNAIRDMFLRWGQ